MITVSLWTITACVDRLLAPLLRLRYRQLLTLRKVYTVAIASWVCNDISTPALWCFSLDAWKVLFGTNIAVCLIASTYSYTRTFFRLRNQHTKVHNNFNLREPRNQTIRVDITRCRKTVFSRSVAAVSNVVLLFAVFFVGAIRSPRN